MKNPHPSRLSPEAARERGERSSLLSTGNTGQDNSALTPRRRGAAQATQTKQDIREETPVLLRLPDLYPSDADDAAAERIEKQLRQKSTTQSTEPRKGRGEIRVSAQRAPAPPTSKNISA